jgi:hypothetical protein
LAEGDPLTLVVRRVSDDGQSYELEPAPPEAPPGPAAVGAGAGPGGEGAVLRELTGAPTT